MPVAVRELSRDAETSAPVPTAEAGSRSCESISHSGAGDASAPDAWRSTTPVEGKASVGMVAELNGTSTRGAYSGGV